MRIPEANELTSEKRTMNRREFMRIAGVVAAGTTAAREYALGSGLLSRTLLSAGKPNILFILADDYGTNEVGCYGADNYKTPNIDQLAQGGIRFTHAYTPSLCGPSRATILTGRYGFRTGASNQASTGRMSPSVETMIPTVLKHAGYVTSSIGKWGQLPLGPGDFGFDDYLRYRGSGIYWNTQANGRTYVVNGETKELHDKEYMPDLMHKHLVDFITKHKDKPFYVYYSLSHIHGEILPTPDSVSGKSDDYTDNIVYMDKLVGKLTAELDRLGIREKTLIVFFGDNGTVGGRSQRATIGGKTISGSKGSMLEGGSLVPLLANWPKTTPAGKVSDHMVDSTDFLPTFAELAGAQLPAGKIIDGRSFAHTLRGEKGESREWVFIQLGSKWYVRDAGWKLTQSGELYDMSESPFTEKSVPKDSKDAAAVEARTRLQAALDRLNPAGGIPDDGGGKKRPAKRKRRK